MMEISEHVFAVPVVDNDVVVGSEGAAIIDTVHESFSDEFIEQLSKIVSPEQVRYVVVNHMEPDHSSSIEALLRWAPHAKILISQTGAKLFSLPGDVLPVKDSDTLSLGDVSLKFIHTPWTHWPETMVTFVPEDEVAFTCDLFGAYGAYPDLSTEDWDAYLLEARRYYVTVLSKYARFVSAALGKVRALQPKILAPGHGILYSGERLEQILDLYADWTRNRGEGRILVLYGSMYGSVYSKVDALVHALESMGVTVDALDLSREDWSYAMTFVLGADAVVVAYPTYDADVFPPVRFFLETVRDKGLLARKPIYVIEAHGWSSSEQKIRALLDSLDVREVISFSAKQPLTVDAIEDLAQKLAGSVQ